MLPGCCRTPRCVYSESTLPTLNCSNCSLLLPLLLQINSLKLRSLKLNSLLCINRISLGMIREEIVSTVGLVVILETAVLLAMLYVICAQKRATTLECAEVMLNRARTKRRHLLPYPLLKNRDNCFCLPTVTTPLISLLL